MRTMSQVSFSTILNERDGLKAMLKNKIIQGCPKCSKEIKNHIKILTGTIDTVVNVM